MSPRACGNEMTDFFSNRGKVRWENFSINDHMVVIFEILFLLYFFVCKITTIIIIMIVSVWIGAMHIASSSDQEIDVCYFSLLFMARYVGQPKMK